MSLASVCEGVQLSAKGTSPGPKLCRRTRLAGLRDPHTVELGTETVTMSVSVTRPLKSADLSIMFLVEVLQPGECRSRLLAQQSHRIAFSASQDLSLRSIS
jgi:hypothetical protein